MFPAPNCSYGTVKHYGQSFMHILIKQCYHALVLFLIYVDLYITRFAFMICNYITCLLRRLFILS